MRRWLWLLILPCLGCGSIYRLRVGPSFSSAGTARLEVQLAVGLSLLGESSPAATLQLGSGELGTRAGAVDTLGVTLGGRLVADAGPDAYFGVGYFQRGSAQGVRRGAQLDVALLGRLGGRFEARDLAISRWDDGRRAAQLFGGAGLQPRLLFGDTRFELFVPVELNLWLY